MPSPWSRDKYYKAFLYAVEALNEKIFPGTNLPFAVHISLVSMEVIAALQAESGLNGDLAVQCGLLHDVIDYGDKTVEALRAEFGDEIAQGVQSLSNLDGVPESQKLTDSLVRIKKQPREIWMVKMADKVSNLASPPRSWTPTIIEAYKRSALQTYEALKSASAFLAERLLEEVKASEKHIKH